VKGPIIGVVKDFHFQSLHEPLRPLMMRLDNRYNFAVIKLQSVDLNPLLKTLKVPGASFDDRFRFEFQFLDAQLNQLYQEEKTWQVCFDISRCWCRHCKHGVYWASPCVWHFRATDEEVSIAK